MDDIINELCREFREQRDVLLGMSQSKLKGKLDEFWNDQPWYLRLFRKRIMKEVYKSLKKLGENI